MKDKHFNHEEVAMADKRKAYEEKFDARFKEWSAKVSPLSVKTDKAGAEVKITDIR
jgi:hypothetical protein